MRILTVILILVGTCAMAQSDTIVPYKKIFVAEGFSPNGDNWNDELLVEAKLWPNRAGEEIRVDINSIAITNIDGKVVFETTDPKEAWNGNDGETECPMGTYYWSVTYSFPGVEEYTEKGLVLLIR